jgi:PUA domain protein
MAIGITKMTGADIRTTNKGVAVENVHYLMDGLWQNPKI